MHRLGILATSGILTIAAVAGAQSTPAASTTAPSARARRPTPEMASVTGTVKQYRKGKSIVIVGPDGRGRKLVVDGTTRIDGPVSPGQSVTAVWMTDDAGRPHVHSLSAYPRTSAETATSAGPSGAAPPAHAAPPARPDEPTPAETAVPPTATPHAPAEDATTPGPRRTPLPGSP